MGANAQTSVPVFTAGQVLTAQQQTEINTGIPVFATTTTRDAAFGGTGEKTLAEGQFAYIEASNTTQYYDGAAWQTLGGGLVFLTAVTFTNQTTVAFANSLFSSAYRNYQVFLECDPVTTGNTWTMQLRTNAGVANAAQYVGGLIGTAFTGGTANVGTNSQTAFNLGSTTVDQNNLAMTVFNPNANDRQTSWSGTVFNNSVSDLGGAFGGTYLTVGAYTGLQFNFSSAVTGTYRVYGLADA